ncbi:HAMP domain-containing sensor histidine kinase [Acuticoccus sp. MNP-M23]|uniref:sensor histidine kinase n=1 Tax=Acuticoccus sp. MNP-M23 TaxID=3072793 RepID=UPI002815D1C2|nr:HAMP domain-containing sensor histidine kinase [Acuticoccus sp. MNP-M23]WMS41914.1 HAMP domain-containing sensor histidine kinase [Acuticoccus sp. MNP-M23]
MNEVRSRTIARWSAVIAALLLVQTAFLSGAFVLFVSIGQARDNARTLDKLCAMFAQMPISRAVEEASEVGEWDVHRRYLLAVDDASDGLLSGNIVAIPDDLDPAGTPQSVAVERTEPSLSVESDVVARMCTIDDGARMFVGFDRGSESETLGMVKQALAISLVPTAIFAVLGGWFLGTRATERVERVRDVARSITKGDLTRRLPTSRTPDSFDRLSLHINVMLDRIETLLEEVRGVSDDIAHQLRTPLTRLHASLQRMVEESTDNVPVTRVEGALTEARRTLAIVASMLRIREASDERRRRLFEPVELADLVLDVVDLYEPLAAESGVALAADVSGSAIMVGDRDLLMEAVANLVDNAIKFVPGGRVDVVLTQPEGAAMICVIDDGAGIAPAEMDELSKRFSRSWTTAGVDGLGLGLSLVARIAELHDLALRSQQRQPGSRARVCLIPRDDPP